MSNDTLKTAKRCIQAIDMSCDGMQTKKDLKKAQVKERQKGKSVIKEELRNYGAPQEKKE